jgi:hypothetical protein
MSRIRFNRWNSLIAILVMASMFGVSLAVAQEIENYQVMQLKCNRMGEPERGRCLVEAKAKDEDFMLRCEGLTSAKQMCLADMQASNEANCTAPEGETRQRQIDQEESYLDCGPFGC